ncbi:MULTISPECIES: hypothetical protein [unclassified Pseudomonas]|uniref:hypothetical protein n=1 Tax=unclassified Pseudomonas TaxID=196821 RepID=UPI0021BAE973|nr:MULTISPECIES: hypothetical protein [unclassified Pseudomonas]MCT8166769.1 hypothetical protein [Pseudomonas sp. HD6422]MCT8185682.1 hypothetical protein [Pseudomonas sp. HD6421]
MNAIDNYRAALQRLVNNSTRIVQAPYLINKDTVALEAGRKRGSIKKGRQAHRALIEEIEAASTIISACEPVTPTVSHERNIARREYQKKTSELKADYELALQKIVSLIQENHNLRLQIEELTPEKHCLNVYPLTRNS